MIKLVSPTSHHLPATLSTLSYVKQSFTIQKKHEYPHHLFCTIYFISSIRPTLAKNLSNSFVLLHIPPHPKPRLKANVYQGSESPNLIHIVSDWN